jgi:hypothetical protein
MSAKVQNVVDGSNPADGDAIIGSGGTVLRKVTLHDEPALEVKQGTGSGTVQLATAGARKAAYDRQYLTDQKSWTSLPQTLISKTGVSALTPVMTCHFRSQEQTEKRGIGAWSPVVSFLVQQVEVPGVESSPSA